MPPFAQVVCITDPALAMDILKSPHVDKVRFLYSFLDPVRASSVLITSLLSLPFKVGPACQ